MPRGVPILTTASLLAAFATAARVRSSETSHAWLASPSLRAASGAEPSETGGYTIHLFNSKEAQKDPLVKVRPLYKKTLRCRNANPWSCEECSGGPECLTLRRDTGDRSEYLYIEANGSDWKRWRHHRVRANLHCPATAEFTIAANVTVQGWMNQVGMSVDGVPTSTEGDDSHEKTRSVMLSKTWHGSWGRIVEVDMHIQLRRQGWARVNDMVVHMSSDYLTCQDHTACLSVLEESEGGTLLRNSNTLQLECLQGSLAGNVACEEWRRCLDQAQSTDRLRTLLLAAGVSTGEGGKALLAQSRDVAPVGAAAGEEPDKEPEMKPAAQAPMVNPCIDPRIDDPESWLCSCMDKMEETCAAVSPVFMAHAFSTQDCLTAQMCLDPSGQICGAWKEDVGCNGTSYAIMKAALTDHMAAQAGGAAPDPEPHSAAALLARARAGAGGKHQSMLDASVGGKATITCDK